VLDTVNGLPATLSSRAGRLVPLTALLAVVVVLWPAARHRVGGATLFVAAGTLVAIVLTTMTGQ
jgi:integral membrane sensor domain MASE1